MFGFLKRKKEKNIFDINGRSENGPRLYHGIKLELVSVAPKSKLATIKMLKEVSLTNSLAELKDVVDNCGQLKTTIIPGQEQEIIARLEAIGAVATLSVEEVPSSDEILTLVLVDCGRQKMAVIKILRTINPDYGLKQAKWLAEKGGEVMTADAQIIIDVQHQLESVGAKVEIS